MIDSFPDHAHNNSLDRSGKGVFLKDESSLITACSGRAISMSLMRGLSLAAGPAG